MIQFLVWCLLLAAGSNAMLLRPPKINVAKEARRLVHQANWASVATISSDGGYPMVNLLSTADSKVGADSTGDIFFYMMGMDKVATDIKKENKISFMFTDAQEGDCNKRGADPWSHQCPRTIISGQVKRLETRTDEYTRGMNAFLSRHPSAANWPNIPVPDHGFYLCKLEITNVMVFTRYGYVTTTPQKYYSETLV